MHRLERGRHVSAEVLRFELSEYQQRLAKARQAMENIGADILIATNPSNMAWLTGYDGWSFYVHQCVVVFKDRDPLWFGRQMDANGCRRTAYLDDSRIFSYEDHYVQSDTLHPMTVLADILTKEGAAGSRIGVEMDNYFFTAAAYETLKSALPNAKFVNANRVINRQRIVKSQRELEYMRGAGKVVEGMYARLSDVLRPGVTQSDVVAEIYFAATKGAGGFWGDYPAAVPMIGAGADASAPHLTWSDKPVRANESIFFELAGVHKRYHCPLSRTYYLGKPTDKVRDAEKAVLEGVEAGLEKAVSGNTCEDIAVAYSGALAKYGLKKESRAGYSIGMAYPPDWGEHSASLRSGDQTALVPGMTFHFMSGLWYGDWGIEITESIVIQNGQVECLSSVPRKLLVIE